MENKPIHKAAPFNWLIKTYFILLFVLLVWVYYPSFFHPPRSDNWAALYNFYRIDMLAQACKWKYLVMYDPLINATFRPFSFLILYFEYNIFGANYIYSHLINFGLYFISIILLYKLATYFCKDKILIISFLTVFAFLFSHFDIVAWAFHSHIILSFSLFLWGFILYIRYLKCTRKALLFAIAAIFLIAMLLYEAYLLWPFGVMVLTYLNGFDRESGGKTNASPKPYLLVIGITYFGYFSLFLFNSFVRATYGAGIALNLLFSLGSIVKNIFAVFSNILLNNFLLNLYPFWAFPLKVDENLNLGGLIYKYAFNIDRIILLAGGATAVILFCWILYAFKRKHLNIIKVVSFFGFLLISELFVLFHVKSLVNPYPYNFMQFRFQYVPNALFMLIILLLFDNILKSSKAKKWIVFAVLFFVLILNVQATRRGISLLSDQLTPLQKLLFNINQGFKDNRINSENKLFLDDQLALRFPPLCWNREMGKRCMRGTYQWMFSKHEIGCFSPYDEATWVISEKMTLVGK